MKFCQEHWSLCRKAVDDRGMSSLVARDGQAALDNVVAELQGDDAKKTFDPLMSLHWHFVNEALRCGGLYVMGDDPSGKNEGHYCPLCEFASNSHGFIAEEAIGNIANQMADWARSEGLIPAVS